MNMKKIAILALSLCMIAAIAVTGTIAYFTDTDENNNTFSFGNVDITLDEAPVEKNEENDQYEEVEGDRVTENEYPLIYPGATLPKDPTIHNEGDSDAYVRVKVRVERGINWMHPVYGKGWAEYEDNFMAMINDTLGTGWEIVDTYALIGDENYIEYTINYTPRLEAGEDTTAVFTEIYIPTTLTNEIVNTYIGEYPALTAIDIYAEAVQAEGFTSVEEAFAATFDYAE